MVSRALVITPTRAPHRAAAMAASVPACPAPTTMTSKDASSDPVAEDADIVVKPMDGKSCRKRSSGSLIIPNQSQEVCALPLNIPSGAPVLVIRRAMYEARGLKRSEIDERLQLTADEFRVEGGLVVLGPIHAGADEVADFIDELEKAGLTYFEDFFELSGNWPDWLQLFAGA